MAQGAHGGGKDGQLSASSMETEIEPGRDTFVHPMRKRARLGGRKDGASSYSPSPSPLGTPLESPVERDNEVSRPAPCPAAAASSVWEALSWAGGAGGTVGGSGAAGCRLGRLYGGSVACVAGGCREPHGRSSRPQGTLGAAGPRAALSAPEPPQPAPQPP